MKLNHYFLAVLLLFISFSGFSQEDSLAIESPIVQESLEEEEERDYKPYNALAPAKAAFYSAILPGLGQAYNGRYWKIPLVYAGIGTGVYFYINNKKDLNRYRNIYKRRLAGYRDDEFIRDGVILLEEEALIRAQQLFRRNMELSLLVTAGLYALNIIDANVDAHLQQFNVNEDLTLKPNFDFDEFSGKTRYGLSLNYNF